MAFDTGGSVVLEQRHTTQMSPGGRFESAVEITFQTPSGWISHVMIPETILSEETTARAIKEKTETHEAIGRLGR